ncbi:MAG: PilZ domain-containing protein [Candidatus Methylomirabilales bacterium]
MIRKFGPIRRDRLEDIWVSVRGDRSVPYVELRVSPRVERPGARSPAGQEAIRVPVGVLSELLRVLGQAQDCLVTEGLVHVPACAKARTPAASESLTVHLADTPGHRGDRRRDPRAPFKMPIYCHPMDEIGTSPMAGEIQDVSRGGAALWLPKRLPLYSRVEVIMRIAGLIFRGKAEVVGATVHAKNGSYRHSFRWLA